MSSIQIIRIQINMIYKPKKLQFRRSKGIFIHIRKENNPENRRIDTSRYISSLPNYFEKISW